MSVNLSFDQVIGMSLDDYIEKSGLYVSASMRNPRPGNQDRGSVSQQNPIDESNGYDKNVFGEAARENQLQDLISTLNTAENNVDNGYEMSNKRSGRLDLEKSASMEKVRQWNQTQQKSQYNSGRKNKNRQQNHQHFQQNRYRKKKNNQFQNQLQNFSSAQNFNQNFAKNGYRRQQNVPWVNMNTNQDYFNRNQNALISYPMNNLKSLLDINPYNPISSEVPSRNNCSQNIIMGNTHENRNVSNNNLFSAGSSQSGTELLNSSTILNDSGVIKLELMPILASALLEKLSGTPSPKPPELKYDKKIQKDIHTLQGKPFIYKCPGGDVISSDGPGLNTTITPATTGISLNQRFA